MAESDKWNLELDWMCGELSTLPLTGCFFFFCLKNNQYKNIVLSFLALLLVSLHSSLLVEVLFFFFNELMFNLISLVSFLSGAG